MSDINTLMGIENWHAAARPDPDPSALSVQIGCHFEEVAELVDALLGDDERSDTALYMLSQKLKRVADRAPEVKHLLGRGTKQRKPNADSSSRHRDLLVNRPQPDEDVADSLRDVAQDADHHRRAQVRGLAD